MVKVLGIGGVFFRSKDPMALMNWYNKHFGITTVPDSYEADAWRTNGGTTVFAPFPNDTKMFGKKSQQWMINFRVADLDAALKELIEAGIPVKVDPEDYPNGKFAELNDPEGNPIQLWQPAGASLDTEEA